MLVLNDVRHCIYGFTLLVYRFDKAFGRFDEAFGLDGFKSYLVEFISTLLFVFASVSYAGLWPVLYLPGQVLRLPCDFFVCFLVLLSDKVLVLQIISLIAQL